jgi:general secretion pathway protein D
MSLKIMCRNILCLGLANSLVMPVGIGIAFAQDEVQPPPPSPPPPPVGDLPEEQPFQGEEPPMPEPPPGNDAPGVRGSSASSIKPSGDSNPSVSDKAVSNGKKGADAVPPGQELVNMDFPEPTEIKDIIRAVALWTGKNVILDRNVTGKIQIISPKRVTKEEAYQAFLSALNVLQFTTVETGKIIKIMPIRTAIKGNLRTFLGSKWTPLTDEIITQIIPLKYVDAKSMVNTLNRLITPNSLVAYEKTNTLIISDSGYKVRRILDILDLIDVQGQQPQVSFVPIRYADAKTIAERVTEILKANSSGGGSFGNFKLMTDERSNSVIVFGPPRTISDVQSLVKKFDIELDDPSRQSSIHVRPLEYADAKKIASTLSALAQGTKKRPNSFAPPVISNGRPGSPAESPGSETAQLDDNTKITADEASNSLLITGSRAAYQSVNSIIRKLDIRRSQVFVEADILDLSSDNGFAFGTNIFAGTKAGQNPVITTWQGSGMSGLVAAQATSQTGTTANPEAAKQVASTFASDMTIGILSNQTVSVPGLGDFSPGALIKLIKSDQNTRVLSSPHIMTANNEEAKIEVGERVFFRSEEVNATSGVKQSKVEKEDVVLSLSLKPNISNSNYVTMKVDIEANDATMDPVSQLPNVKKRRSSQTMTVKNGQTVVVSGLVKKSEREVFQKIPLLGDIPILGWLFRNSTINHGTSNMMIFLTPHVIHGADDLAAIYQNKVKERDEYLEYIYGDSYKEDRFYAMMPKAEDGTYRPDATDLEEKNRREAVLRDYKDADQPPGGGLSSEQKDSLTTPTPVPMNAGVGGPSGSSPLSSPVPMQPAPGAGEGGGEDFSPEPPPPPPEAMPEPPPPLD